MIIHRKFNFNVNGTAFFGEQTFCDRNHKKVHRFKRSDKLLLAVRNLGLGVVPYGAVLERKYLLCHIIKIFAVIIGVGTEIYLGQALRASFRAGDIFKVHIEPPLSKKKNNIGFLHPESV